MYFATATTILLSPVFFSLASGLGINCRGSSTCAGLGGSSANVGALQGIVDGKINTERNYANGEHIACFQAIAGDGICAFPQGMPESHTMKGSAVLPLLQALGEHGCTKCGSVPIHFVDQNGNNDPSDGILTINFVISAGCNGLCEG